ncbi:unnamed protein product [Lactuca virosa]|uniref:Uncharacterized protein n=1 Tax=Lactuca virosa TaxID=75947 RepID=A0AAU9P5U6_9ASTR|nr:unnamed protein product [Lactuca virosa]
MEKKKYEWEQPQGRSMVQWYSSCALLSRKKDAKEGGSVWLRVSKGRRREKSSDEKHDVTGGSVAFALTGVVMASGGDDGAVMGEAEELPQSTVVALFAREVRNEGERRVGDEREVGEEISTTSVVVGGGLHRRWVAVDFWFSCLL